MARAKAKVLSDGEKTVLLLEKLLVVQLQSRGVPQANIAKMVGRDLNWVNGFLKNIPKERK